MKRFYNNNFACFQEGTFVHLLGGRRVRDPWRCSRKSFSCVLCYAFSLTHFCWKDRTSGTVEDDLIIFPDDCEFKKVEQCKDGRVFLLRFKSSNRKLFFWLQEPTNEKDDEHCRRVNELLNNPPSSGGNGGGSGNREGSDLQYMLNNMSQQQLMQLFGGVGQMGGLSSLLGSINRNSTGSRNSTSTPSSGTRSSTAAAGGTAVQTPVNTTQPATPRAPRKEPSSGESTDTSPPAAAGSTDASRVLLSELQNYLAGINTSGGASGSKHNVDLSTSLNSESINSILSDPERLEALQAHLPSIDDDGKPIDPNAVKQQLKDTLASPQFQQALSMFSNALQSGQLGPVVSQFKLSDDAVSAANSGDLEQFVKALEKASIKDSSAKDDEAEDKKDESKN